jgi:hypothetical protein
MHLVLVVAEHPHGGDQEEGPEHQQQPLEPLEQGDTREDEGEPQHQGAEDTPEQHPELELLGDREVAHDERPHEDVVDAQALLDQVARDVLARGLTALPGEDDAGEGDADADPHRRLDGGFLGGGCVRAAVDKQQVGHEQHRHENDEGEPDPERDVEAGERAV